MLDMEITGLSPDLKLGTPADLKHMLMEFRIGQILKAIAEGSNASGLLKLRIGQQLFTARSQIPIEIGRNLRLQVEKAGPQPELRILDELPPATIRAEALRQTLPRMLELVPALGRMSQLTQTDGGAEKPPPAVQQLVQNLMRQVPGLEQTMSSKGLQAALLQSGLFTEALLGRGRVPGPDLKSALQRVATRLRAVSAEPHANIHRGTITPTPTAGDGTKADAAALPRGPAQQGLNATSAHRQAALPGKTTLPPTALSPTGKPAISTPYTTPATTARVSPQSKPTSAQNPVTATTGKTAPPAKGGVAGPEIPGRTVTDAKATPGPMPRGPLSPLPTPPRAATAAPPATPAPGTSAPAAPTAQPTADTTLPQYRNLMTKAPFEGLKESGAQRQTGSTTPQAPADPTTTRLVAELSRQVEGALSRIQYNQLNSLPQEDPNRLVWQLELPLRQGERLESFRLRVEEEKAKRKSGAYDTAWRVDIEFNLAPLGPMRVRIGLLGEKVSSVFWAERIDTTHLIERRLDELHQSLERVGLEVGQLSAHRGAPPQQPAGANLDSLLDEQA